MFYAFWMARAEGMKKDTSHNYVYAAGCSTVDYYICSQEFTEYDMKLHVAEKFESKHLPKERLLFPKEYQSTSKEPSLV